MTAWCSMCHSDVRTLPAFCNQANCPLKLPRPRVATTSTLEAEPAPAAGSEPGWRCFHCRDYYAPNQIEEARAHFGPTQDSAPACIDHGSDFELLARARRAEADLEAARRRVQETDDEAERLAIAVSAWKSCFRRVRFDSPEIAFHHYDFMEGRALVAMEKVDHARRELPLFVNVANCLDAGATPKECAAELRLIIERLEKNLGGGGKPAITAPAIAADGKSADERDADLKAQALEFGALLCEEGRQPFRTEFARQLRKIAASFRLPKKILEG